MLDELLLFVSKLYESNLAFFYLVVLKFTKNYPFETHHKCFNYDEAENKAKYTYIDGFSKWNYVRCSYSYDLHFSFLKKRGA